MSEARQAAEKAVEAVLEQLRAVSRTEEPDPDDPEDELLTAWVLVASRVSYDDDGDPNTGLTIYMPEMMPEWQTAGLLRAGQVLVEQG